MIATDYAKALHALIQKNPGHGRTYLKNLQEALQRRGHLKLLPRIFAEYQKLQQKDERAERYAAVTPERERTRTLLELYRKLVSS